MFQQKVDVIDLIIRTLHEHEKNISELEGNLYLAVMRMNKLSDRLCIMIEALQERR